MEQSRPRDTFTDFAAHAPIGIMRADAAGKCIYANAAWFAMTGLTPEETVGYAWSTAVHPDDLEKTMAAWAESIGSGRQYVNEVRLVTKAGEVKRVIAHASAIQSEDGVITGYIGTVMDITSLHESQQLLRRLIDVQEAERRSLCHDFHDGLIQHVIAAQMLLEAHQSQCHPEAPSAELEQVLVCLRRGVSEARRVIRGIRTSVLDDLGLTAAIDDLAEQLADFGLTVRQHVDSGIEAESPEMQLLIFRVVQEALHNVRKHAGDPEPSVGIGYEDGLIKVVVEDRGIGFDVMSSGDHGFGLLGMRERAKLAGGTCRVESKPGQGTRVVVRLPSCRSEPRGATSVKSPTTPSAAD